MATASSSGVIGDHGQHGPENFFASDAYVAVHAGEDGRGHPESFGEAPARHRGAAERDGGTLDTGPLDVTEDAVTLVGVNDGPHVGVPIPGRPTTIVLARAISRSMKSSCRCRGTRARVPDSHACP